MSQENEIEAKILSPTGDFLPSDGASCSALGLAVPAWERKRPRPDLRLEIAAIIHADSVAELADNLEYIAARLRETGWTAGSGGGKHSKAVWEMFCKPNSLY